MIFTTTHRYSSLVPNEDLVNRLTGNKVHIHNLDFEVIRDEQSLSIIPFSEEENTLKTLPITQVDVQKDGNKTKVVITSKMRKIDSGGPMLVMLFCTFLLLASLVLLYIGGEPQITYTLLGMGMSIFVIFCIRMQMGYFDYVRKIRNYVKSNLGVQFG